MRKSMFDFQDIFRFTPDAYLVVGVDPDFTLLEVNEAYLRATMTERDAVVGRPLFEVFPDNPATPELRSTENLRASLQAAIGTKQRQFMPPTQYDMRHPAEGGAFEQRFWRICNIPLLNRAGDVTAILHRVEDVTAIVQLERTRREQEQANELLRSRANAAEQAILSRTAELTKTQRQLDEDQRLLHEAQARLEVAIHAGDLATFVWEPQLDRVHADDNLRRWFRLTPDQAAGGPLADYLAAIHPDDLDAVHRAIRQSLAGEEPREIEFRLRDPGHERRLLARSRVELDADRRPLRFLGVLIDVTRQRRIESKLHESEARYRLVIENLQDYAIFMLDDDGIVTHWNAGAERLLGFTSSEILGRPGRIVFTPEDQARGEPEKELATAKTEGSATDDRWHMRKDGTRLFVSGLMVALNDASGRRIGLAKVMRDITDRQIATLERERLLESERAARAEAERTSRLKDEFLATLSHELRTPLNAILGWTQVLKEGGLSPGELLEGLEVIDRNTHVQAELIEDLLDMSRIVSGKVRLNVQRLDVAVVVNAAIESVQAAAAAKHITLRARFGHESAHVMGDRTRLQQVAWNLLSNAIKFTPERGWVEITTERTGSHLVLRVRDNGAGISPDFLPHVFERFRQADASTTRRHGGLGLGLSIVKQLVELHGGEVTVESAGLNQGTTLSVSIPLIAPEKTPDNEPPIPKKRATVKSSIEVDLAGISVLVVEDEPDSAHLVRRVLESHHAQVRAAGSVDEAIETMKSFRPDVLVSDIGMPLHDGYELIRRVRELPQGATLPAAALTALARAEDVQRALAAGFQTHVAKPVEPAELLAVVAALADRAPNRSTEPPDETA
jgi:PAS domain S-box-containing protein